MKIIDYLIKLQESEIDYVISKSLIDGTCEYIYVELTQNKMIYCLTFHDNEFLYGYINDTCCFEDIEVINY